MVIVYNLEIPCACKKETRMKKVAILTDNTACLSQDLLVRYKIATIPLQVIWGEETFARLLEQDKVAACSNRQKHSSANSARSSARTLAREPWPGRPGYHRERV
jgi:hypothetical protein